jgi:hypothetical protein
MLWLSVVLWLALTTLAWAQPASITSPVVAPWPGTAGGATVGTPEVLTTPAAQLETPTPTPSPTPLAAGCNCTIYVVIETPTPAPAGMVKELPAHHRHPRVEACPPPTSFQPLGGEP